MRKGQSRKFRQHFAKYACVGDRITAKLPGGFTAVAFLERDDCGDTPEERQDGFWPSRDKTNAGYIGDVSFRTWQRHVKRAQAIMDAWNKDEWFYCGVCVGIEKNNIRLTGIYDHSLWGVDCNFPFLGRWRPNSYLRDVANELLGEALAAAKLKLESLTPAGLALVFKKVVIEVSGGVAECTTCPEGVDVTIIDHDNENHE